MNKNTKLTGKKIVGSKYEQQLMEWIVKNPKVSNLALSKRVQEFFDEKVASATVKAWRTSQFDSKSIKALSDRVIKAKAKTAKIDEELSNKVASTIDFYLRAAAKMDEKISNLQEELCAISDLKDVLIFLEGFQDDPAKVEFKARFSLAFLTKSTMELEKLLIDYYKLADTYRARAYKFTGGVEYLHRLQTVITSVSTAAIRVFFPHVSKDRKDVCKREFTIAIEQIEQKLRDSLPYLAKEVE